MIQGFAFDQRGQLSNARDSYMQATRLYAPLFKKFPQAAYPDMWRREATLCLKTLAATNRTRTNCVEIK